VQLIDLVVAGDEFEPPSFGVMSIPVCGYVINNKARVATQKPKGTLVACGVSGTYVIDEARIKSFAAQFDPSLFQLNESAAQASILQGLAASGWRTAAVALTGFVDGGLPFAQGIAGLGGEIAWTRHDASRRYPRRRERNLASRAKFWKSGFHGPNRSKGSSPFGVRCSIKAARRSTC
jgi:hypothetical protein